VIASGGVASLADLEALRDAPGRGIAGAICGRALYDGRIDLAAAVALLKEPAPC
jgi:phosphoribosylformimino-5-aminoimidazole carboxamide ribotide isomerase